MVLALCSCSVVRRARDFSLAGIFADNMVLQREVSVPVFGTGENGITVTVSFNGQEKSTVIENGEWRVDLDAEPACKEGKTLSFSLPEERRSRFQMCLSVTYGFAQVSRICIGRSYIVLRRNRKDFMRI